MTQYERVPLSEDLEEPSTLLPPFPADRSRPTHTDTLQTRALSFFSELSGSVFNHSARERQRRSSHLPLLPTIYTTDAPSELSYSAPSQNTQTGQKVDASSNSKSLRVSSNHTLHVRILRLLWITALLAGEHGSYWAMVNRCTWPENSSWDPSSSAAKDRYRIAIIADPQLTDWMSYHQSGLLLTLVETYTDLFMKRSFRRLHKSLKPDAVLFLGDLNDGGRNSNEDVFDKNSKRFLERVFETGSTAWNKQPVVRDALDPSTLSEPAIEADNVNITGRYLQHVEVPLHSDEREVIRNSGKSVRLYVAGNHDVGFGNTLIRSSMVRYKETFGSVNYEIDVGNHTLVVLDTLALSSGITDIREESQQLLAQIEKEQLRLPRILFTHVPLFRLDTTPCGDARETKRVIVNEWGEQYQNMVQAPLTKDILHAIKPDMVFSGDDHDWCEVAHSLDGTLTPEVTLPTFSFAQGIQQAGFVMLSLYNPDLKTKNVFPVVPTTSASGLPLSTEGNDGTMIRPSMDATFAYEECMLPNQLLIYGCYGLLFGCSLLWILIRRYRWVTRGWSYLHEQHLRSEWRDSLSVSVDTEPQGSTTATAISSRQQQYEQLLDRIDSEDSEDDTIVSETPVEKDASRLSSSFQGRHPMQSLLSTIYWKMVGWDLWNVARFAVPFYVILFVISFL